jgi:hypothetical protein
MASWDFRMARVADMAQRRCQVGRSDEHAVHALHRRDLVHGIDTRTAFYLQQHADVVVDGVQVVRHRAVTVAALRARHAAHALRRIASGRHRATRVFLGFDERNQQVVEADVQQPLDLHRIVPGRPAHGGAGAALQGLQLLQEHRHLVGRMLAVQEQPVEIGQPHELGRDVAGHAHPESDEPFARQDALPETVG